MHMNHDPKPILCTGKLDMVSTVTKLNLQVILPMEMLSPVEQSKAINIRECFTVNCELFSVNQSNFMIVQNDKTLLFTLL